MEVLVEDMEREKIKRGLPLKINIPRHLSRSGIAQKSRVNLILRTFTSLFFLKSYMLPIPWWKRRKPACIDALLVKKSGIFVAMLVRTKTSCHGRVVIAKPVILKIP